MPELPEVETVRRGLRKYILHKKIIKISQLGKCDTVCFSSDLKTKNVIRWTADRTVSSGDEPVGVVRNIHLLPLNLKNDSKRTVSHLPNLSILSLRRFGKALVIDLDGGWSLMIHLRMTGQLIWRGKTGEFAAGHPSENFVAELPNKQTRVVFEFEDGKLFFNDQRKFGFVKAIPTTEVEQDAFIKKLGPEPWKMTADEFYKRCQRHKKALIKAVLLNQEVIAGLGNIYADEALFDAKVHPERRAGELSKTEVEKILMGARKVMEAAIGAGGSTMATYVKADGSRGNYLDEFAQVFGKQGQKCSRCGTEIVKIRVAGRGTHICPHCQKRGDK